MSTATETRRQTAAPYTPPATRDEILAEAIGCIIAGRPLPEYLRAPQVVRARPATAEEGMRPILAGGAAVG